MLIAALFMALAQAPEVGRIPPELSVAMEGMLRCHKARAAEPAARADTVEAIADRAIAACATEHAQFRSDLDVYAVKELGTTDGPSFARQLAPQLISIARTLLIQDLSRARGGGAVR